jgi:hypothetical protein
MRRKKSSFFKITTKQLRRYPDGSEGVVFDRSRHLPLLNLHKQLETIDPNARSMLSGSEGSAVGSICPYLRQRDQRDRLGRMGGGDNFGRKRFLRTNLVYRRSNTRTKDSVVQRIATQMQNRLPRNPTSAPSTR